VSRALKVLARTIGCPVVALSQLNRDLEKRTLDKRPQLADLRDSGALEQDADTVLTLYRDDYYNDASPDRGVCEVGVPKQRNGPAGPNVRARLRWHAETMTFSDDAPPAPVKKPHASRDSTRKPPPREQRSDWTTTD
jgi:replicative DNA helicase